MLYSIIFSYQQSFLSNAGFVHRDLAARNVLLGEGKVIKISDFGLMRHMYGDIYEMKRRKKLPIKWTAPEALYSSLYTSKSDVYVFWMYVEMLALTTCLINSLSPSLLVRNTTL